MREDLRVEALLAQPTLVAGVAEEEQEQEVQQEVEEQEVQQEVEEQEEEQLEADEAMEDAPSEATPEEEEGSQDLLGFETSLEEGSHGHAASQGGGTPSQSQGPYRPQFNY